MRLFAYSLTIAGAVSVTAFATSPAVADCAEDLTRIQLHSGIASPDIKAVIGGLVSTAQERMKALDSTGCRAATGEAMKLLGLTSLAPLTLSTPVPGLDRNPQAPAPDQASAQATAPAPQPDKSASAAPVDKNKDAPVRAAPAAPASPVTPTAPAIPSTAQSAQKGNPPAKSGQDWYVVTSDLIGKPVVSQDDTANSIGVIKAIAIDSTTQRAVVALVETGGFLGIGGDLIAIPFGALMFNERWERPVVRANTEVIQSGPRVSYNKISEQLADPAWRKQVAEHFGIPLVPASATPNAVPSTTAPPTAAPKAQRQTAPAPASAPAGDAAKGHAYVQQMCVGCHTFDVNGGTRVGPNLHNVFGRPVASMAGFSYSQGLKRHGGAWDAASLNAFLQSPQHFASGTVMAFPGIPSTEERANVIAYLKAIGSTQGAQK